MINMPAGVKKEIRGKLMTDEAWNVVYTAAGMTQAKIITGRLETEGIPTRLKYEAAGTIYAITINGLGEVKILVPAEDLDRAGAILNRSYDEQDLDWEETEIRD
jgi:YD repeat-containing protein